MGAREIDARPLEQTATGRLLDLHEGLCNRARELMSKKNHDYTNAQSAKGGPFANFEHVASFGVATVEQGMFARFTDKVARLGTLLTRDIRVIDEKLEDTILDIINYSILIAAYKAEKARVNS